MEKVFWVSALLLLEGKARRVSHEESVNTLDQPSGVWWLQFSGGSVLVFSLNFIGAMEGAELCSTKAKTSL